MKKPHELTDKELSERIYRYEEYIHVCDCKGILHNNLQYGRLIILLKEQTKRINISIFNNRRIDKINKIIERLNS